MAKNGHPRGLVREGWTGNEKFIGMALAVSDAGIGVVIRSLDDQFKWIGRLVVRSITCFYCLGENS